MHRFGLEDRPHESAIRNLVAKYTLQAAKLNLSTILISSEDFADFSAADYRRFFDILDSVDIYNRKIIWFQFDPRERLMSYTSQYIRQGEYVDSESEEKIYELISDHPEKIEEAAVDSGAIIRRLNYAESREKDSLVQDFLTTIFETDSFLELSDFAALESNYHVSLPPYLLGKLNDFNKVNSGRQFDPSCPIVYSDRFPREKERLAIVNGLLDELAKRDAAGP